MFFAGSVEKIRTRILLRLGHHLLAPGIAVPEFFSAMAETAGLLRFSAQHPSYEDRKEYRERRDTDETLRVPHIPPHLPGTPHTLTHGWALVNPAFSGIGFLI